MEEKNARFKVFTGGPLEVTGEFRIVNTEGKIIERDGPVYLCRCGGSANKPFCDGTHKRIGFSG
jgi:CDGSH-type Zn-finger protein